MELRALSWRPRPFSSVVEHYVDIVVVVGSIPTMDTNLRKAKMFEQSKAALRRKKCSEYITEYVVGDGIDIGAGNNLISPKDYPNITSVVNWDLPMGDAQYLNGCKDDIFDFVHSSHCLEHMVDPEIALSNWIRVCKNGGYLIITVPDEEMYERFNWPSRFNSDHKWSFRIDGCSTMPKSILIQDLLNKMVGINIISIKRITEGFDQNLPRFIDQTLGTAECAIEIVLKKNK